MRPDPQRLAQLFGAEAVGGFDAATLLPADLAGVPVVSPATSQAAGEVMAAATREGWRVWPAGAGEHLQLGTAAPVPDLVVSARRLARIVEYEPEEMVLVAEAGVTLHTIEAAAAPHGQRLASDVWPGRAATIGGAVAGNRVGLTRLGRGTLRDALLGARVVHADGRTSKTGGRVVKNVAGFDLAKLYVGSCGSLALLTEVNLRLAPRPRATALVVAVAERARAEQLLLAVHRSPLVPTALLLVAGAVTEDLPLDPEHVAVIARFEGHQTAVEWQVAEAGRLVHGKPLAADRAGPLYDALRASAEPRPGAVLVRIATLPVAGALVLECLEELAAWQRGGGCVVQFGTGTSHAQLPGLAGRELRLLRARVSARGGRVTCESVPAGFATGTDSIADPVTAELVRRTHAAFDPGDRLRPAPGLGGAA